MTPDWRQLLEDLVKSGPWTDRNYGNCLCCDMPAYNTSHEPTCPWLVARKALFALRGSTPEAGVQADSERLRDIIDAEEERLHAKLSITGRRLKRPPGYRDPTWVDPSQWG